MPPLTRQRACAAPALRECCRRLCCSHCPLARTLLACAAALLPNTSDASLLICLTRHFCSCSISSSCSFLQTEDAWSHLQQTLVAFPRAPSPPLTPGRATNENSATNKDAEEVLAAMGLSESCSVERSSPAADVADRFALARTRLDPVGDGTSAQADSETRSGQSPPLTLALSSPSPSRSRPPPTSQTVSRRADSAGPGGGDGALTQADSALSLTLPVDISRSTKSRCQPPTSQTVSALARTRLDSVAATGPRRSDRLQGIEALCVRDARYDKDGRTKGAIVGDSHGRRHSLPAGNQRTFRRCAAQCTRSLGYDQVSLRKLRNEAMLSRVRKPRGRASRTRCRRHVPFLSLRSRKSFKTSGAARCRTS